MSSSLVRTRVNEFREVVGKLQEDDSAQVVLLTTKRLEDLNSSLQKLLDTSIAEQKQTLRAQLRAKTKPTIFSSDQATNADAAAASSTSNSTTMNLPGSLVSYFQRTGQNLAGVDELNAQQAKLESALRKASSSSKHWQVCLQRCATLLVDSLPTSNKDNARRLPFWIRQQMDHFLQTCFFPLTFYGLEFPCFEKEEELEQDEWDRLAVALQISHGVLQPQNLMYLFKSVCQPIVVAWTSSLLTSDKLSEGEFRARLNYVLPLVRYLPQVGVTVARLFKEFAASANTSAEDMIEWKSLLARYRVVI